jgi:hypothetical protein
VEEKGGEGKERNKERGEVEGEGSIKDVVRSDDRGLQGDRVGVMTGDDTSD